jgi:hypothetical protein
MRNVQARIVRDIVAGEARHLRLCVVGSHDALCQFDL